MILRSITKHVRDQNWFAVGLDFFIVVVGVFIGIQVANWNEAQADRSRELRLLGELRAELVESIEQLEIKSRAFQQVGRSGARAVAFLDSGKDCGEDCWKVLVDFFHASQWQQLVVGRATYDELRRNGWPRSRAVVEALEAYHRQADQISMPLNAPPAYRNLVRGLIPLAAHRPYWLNCFRLKDGEEMYLEECPPGVSPQVAAAAVDAVRAHPDIHRTLTEWTGFGGGMSVTISGLIEAAKRAIAVIDAELEKRRVETSGMHGKVALITGASSGIGRATAELFAAKGAKVVLAASYITGTTLTPDGGLTLTV